jgi:hypothetical protein
VKRIIFFILAIQIITTGNFISELVKFNELIDHYIEHQSGDHPLSIVDFFELHYFDKQHEGSDPVRHSKLPLHQVSTSFVIVFTGGIDQPALNPPLLSNSSEFNQLKKGLVPQFHHIAIFQPPRFA